MLQMSFSPGDLTAIHLGGNDDAVDQNEFAAASHRNTHPQSTRQQKLHEERMKFITSIDGKRFQQRLESGRRYTFDALGLWLQIVNQGLIGQRTARERPQAAICFDAFVQ